MATIKIKFNGQQYERVEDMPPEARQAYELALAALANQNQAGTPDVVESPLPGVRVNTRVRITTSQKITLNGQVYNSVDELPADARQAYQRAVSTLDADQNGVPDMLEGAQPLASFSTTPMTATPPIIPATVAQPADENRLRTIILAGGLILALLLASGLVAVLLYFWLYAGPR